MCELSWSSWDRILDENMEGVLVHGVVPHPCSPMSGTVSAQHQESTAASFRQCWVRSKGLGWLQLQPGYVQPVKSHPLWVTNFLQLGPTSSKFSRLWGMFGIRTVNSFRSLEACSGPSECGCSLRSKDAPTVLPFPCSCSLQFHMTPAYAYVLLSQVPGLIAQYFGNLTKLLGYSLTIVLQCGRLWSPSPGSAY